ncbi:MAG: glycosyl transferase family 1 [Chloroflexi bacterium RBG_13_51_36]|nr:MAG: glycosyl transferase family 1 [Chloroflexi bacterium RBG_13_51_36]
MNPKINIKDYESVVGKNYIEELRMLANRLSGKTILNINSTFVGGGVAEILSRLVPLLNQLGVDVRWQVIPGEAQFFKVTKKFHNALHGKVESISDDDFSVFLETTAKNASQIDFSGDILFIHDPQPAALITKKSDIGKDWVWRCHIDISQPDNRVWNFLKQFVVNYDAGIFSSPNFAQELPIPQFFAPPSIDPLSEKNKELPPEALETVLTKYGLDADKPLILQVSRFDRLKDPLGVIRAFQLVRRNFACQLVLAGGTATDDPESEEVLKEVKERAGDNSDIHILDIPPGSDVDINALQRAATVIMQKSLREGFALTITEALWKAKPVVASAVGGIPLQVKDKLTGLLCHSIEGAAYALRQILANPDYGHWLGRNGKEHVRQHFLITREIRDYMLIFLTLGRREDIIYL